MRHVVFVLFLIAAAVPAAADDTVVWLSIGTGLSWYNEIDPNELEDLATAGSIIPRTPNSSRRINFDDKGLEIPALVQLGVRLTPSANLWGMYQRLPYILDAPIPGLEAGGSPSSPPWDTIRLRAPANVFGGGMDFRLARSGYFESMIFSAGLGLLTFDGGDEDVIGIRNFTIDGQGVLYEGSLMFEIDFAADLKFYPFLSFRWAKITDTNATWVRTPALDPTLPEFEVNYTGITIGLSARFKVWPFESVDDEPSIFDQ